MNEIRQNKKRKLIEEYGPYMNKRYAIYDNTGTLEVWFSDKDKAIDHWNKYRDAETWAEKRDKQKQDILKHIEEQPELNELPFM